MSRANESGLDPESRDELMKGEARGTEPDLHFRVTFLMPTVGQGYGLQQSS